MGVEGKGYVCTEKLTTGKDINIIIISLMISIVFLYLLHLLYLPRKVTKPQKSVPAISEKSVGLNVGKKMDIATGVTKMDFAVEKVV